MTTDFYKHITQETYLEVEKLIHYTVHKFIAKHGGCHHELIEHAGIAFMYAYQHYDPKRGTTFPTFVRYIVWCHLASNRRKQHKESKRISYRDIDPNKHEALREFYLFELLDELSKDAQKVVKLVLRTPPGLRSEIVDKKPQTIRMVLRRHLTTLGWTAERIKESFSEIRKALQ